MGENALRIAIKSKLFPPRTDRSRIGRPRTDKLTIDNSAGYQALRDVNIALPSGQFTCLIGPSGCGKSTLLNILNGLDQDYRGTIELSDPAHHIATMFQTPRLMPWLSVIDNVLLVLPDHSQSKPWAQELLDQMGLRDVLDAFPSQLSGGMQRRVALARAFAIRPSVLLLDEPFVSLDMPVANRLRELLLALWQQYRSTILFVTHDLREALALGDRVIFLSAGPGTVVLDMPITLERPRSVESPNVEKLYRELMATHPQLLAGLVQSEE